MKPIYIVLQAYGHQDYSNEALYLILSYIRTHQNWQNNSLQFVIYTDIEEELKVLENYKDIFHIEKVTQNNIQDWQGKPPFVHRAKIKIIQDFFSKYEGHLLYMDTDTYFLKDATYIFEEVRAGERFMHIAEGQISTKKNPIFRKTYNFLQKESFEFEGNNLKIPLETSMWNAGVLGIPQAQKNLANRVLELSDKMYQKYEKHIIEQLAFSYLMNLESSAHPSDKYIYHYWRFKEFREILKDFFNFHKDLSLEELAEKSTQIIPSELNGDKEKYYELSFFGKTLRKIKGGKWKIPKVVFE